MWPFLSKYIFNVIVTCNIYCAQGTDVIIRLILLFVCYSIFYLFVRVDFVITVRLLLAYCFQFIDLNLIHLVLCMSIAKIKYTGKYRLYYYC